MKALHESSAFRLKEMIGAHGRPGISLVGDEAAVTGEDVAGWQLALLQDRVRTLSSKPQSYSTQFGVDGNGWPMLFPIEDSSTVNERRERLELNSLEKHQEQMIKQERKRRANVEQPVNQAPHSDAHVSASLHQGLQCALR